MTPQAKKIDKKDACPECRRPRVQCFCGRHPVWKNSVKILVLQHPQEQYKLLNSALLAHKTLENSVLRVGLSWRNLGHALGEEADLNEWGVLFLKSDGSQDKVVEVFDRKKRPVAAPSSLKGLVAIDGSWKQAKALWWRNPWLLRLNRISLNPGHRSLRPQVKKEGLATIEAIALVLEYFKEDPRLVASLKDQYAEFIIKPAAIPVKP